MHARREQVSCPAWTSDQLDSTTPPEIEPAYFDDSLHAWVFSRHEDVLAAFRASSLVPAGPHAKVHAPPPDESALHNTRSETQESLSSTQLSLWRDQFSPLIQRVVDTLPEDRIVDLLEDYARPICLSLAAAITGIAPEVAPHLRSIAQPISASAADPHDPVLRTASKPATLTLRAFFHSGPEALRDSGFVALAHTMPSLMANLWYALLQHPHEWTRLHQSIDTAEQAIEELLRYAGLPRTLFRQASEDLHLAGCAIRKDDRIILRIIAANHDPQRFPHPDHVNLTRRAAGHLTLGAGPHACIAANLIRQVATSLTAPLLKRFATGTLAEEVRWQGGSGFRFPVALRVHLNTRKDGFTSSPHRSL
ncbi:cytochrome P450 [Granulicella arctica]|uniref:cytochrome P450 n=1 Tax=Granulicella arctica TaxID=940613 RepID=UPI0021DFDC55|nr:cytochrome P450 [Granulicella arctica]